MREPERPRGYQGGYLVGLIVLVVVSLRTILFYWDQSYLTTALLPLTIYALLYLTEPWLSSRISWYRFLYYPFQTGIVFVFSFFGPFLDIKVILYVPLLIQAFRMFSRKAVIFLSLAYILLVGIVILPHLGLLEGMAFILLGAAVGSFLISYDSLYAQTQADQTESQRLLLDLQSAHRQLREYTAQAEELAAVQERNRLARGLHDSVSQAIFSITLTSQSARLLLKREPARVPGVLERLQEMTSSALSELRSLIAELRPPQTP